MLRFHILTTKFLKIYGDGEETTIYSNGSAFRKVFDKNKNVTDVYSLEGYNTTNQVETQIVQNVYDIYGNLISSKDFSNGENIQKIYTDNFGNTYKTEIGMHDSTFKIQNSFDDSHENITQTEIEIDETEINNTNNKIDKINYNYTYSNTPDPKLESITLQTSSNDTVLSNLTQNLDYDGLDRLTNIAVNGLSKEFSYLKSGDHTTNLISNLTFGINGIKKDNLRYFYDEKGNITQIRENNSLVLRYKYDSLSRLVREDNKILNKTYVFSYDAGGNILNKLIYDFSLVDNLDHLTLISENTYSYPVSGWRDQLKEFNGKEIVYDSLGNPKSYLGKTLVWSHARQLDKFDDIEFQYNASGLRTSKKNNGVTTKFYLNGNKILRQKDGMNDMYFYYGADGIIGFHLKNNFINDDFYFKKNAQNDIIGIYDSNKTLICKYDYDAFGVFRRYLSNLHLQIRSFMKKKIFIPYSIGFILLNLFFFSIALSCLLIFILPFFGIHLASEGPLVEDFLFFLAIVFLTYTSFRFLFALKIHLKNDCIITYGDGLAKIEKVQYKTSIKYSDIKKIYIVESIKNSRNKKLETFLLSARAPKKYLEFLLINNKKRRLCINYYTKKQVIRMLTLINHNMSIANNPNTLNIDEIMQDWFIYSRTRKQIEQYNLNKKIRENKDELKDLEDENMEDIYE